MANSDDIFSAIQSSTLGTTISGSSWMFPTFETIHVLSLSVVLGSIVIVDLRLLGLASMNQRASELMKTYLPFTWIAWLVCLGSGSLLYISRAHDYMQLSVFYVKFAFMALAGVNMAFFHFGALKTVNNWDTGQPAAAAKMAGFLSLFFWAGVVVFARKIGFLI